MIYIATNLHGRGIKHGTAFEDRLDLLSYVDEITAFTETVVNSRDNIDTLCDKLIDRGMGCGSRSHARVSRREAHDLVRNGALPYGF